MTGFIPELLTICALAAIVICGIFKLPADSAEKIALALGSGLVGYLTKTAVDAVKNALTSKDITQATLSFEGGTPQVIEEQK